MLILGLNAYHGDSSACILVDGQLVAAAEEERFPYGALGGITYGIIYEYM